MTGSSVVVGGEWKDIASQLVVVGGEWKPVVSSLVVVGGEWKTGYIAGAMPKISQFDVWLAPATPWGVIYVDWTIDNFEAATDELVITRTGSDGSVYTNVTIYPLESRIDGDVLQGVTYTYELTYRRNGIDYAFAVGPAGRMDRHVIKLQDIPALSMSVSGITSKTAVLDWNLLGIVEQYKMYRYDPSSGAYISSWYLPNTSTTHSFSNKLRAEYWYSYRIRVKVKGEWSPLSNLVKFKTLTSSHAGRHLIDPTNSWTYLPRLNKTMYDKDSLWHGRPRDSSSKKHTPHVTMLHYYSGSVLDPFGDIRLGISEGLQIVKFSIWVQRRYAGPNRGVNLWAQTHVNKTKPSNLGNIKFNSNKTKISDRVGEGWRQGEWVSLPTSLGYAVIKSVGKGIALGKINEPWTYWANFPKGSHTPVGKLKIVLG